MKKAVLIFAAVLMILPSAVTAQAHGHHGNGHHSTVKKTYAPCTVSSCHKTGQHRHNNKYYCGSCITYRQCTVAGCHKNGKHRHKGKCYYGHASGGRRYSQCRVVNCRKTRKHKHNGKYYYGHSTIRRQTIWQLEQESIQIFVCVPRGAGKYFCIFMRR